VSLALDENAAKEASGAPGEFSIKRGPEVVGREFGQLKSLSVNIPGRRAIWISLHWGLAEEKPAS
jgi:hypothetical protein